MCILCGEMKSLREFPHDKTGHWEDGHTPTCKSCLEATEQHNRELLEKWAFEARTIGEINLQATADDLEFRYLMKRRWKDDKYPPGQVIYVLVDPRTDEIRYVGQTYQPERRLRTHVRGDQYNPEKDTWTRELRAL